MNTKRMWCSGLVLAMVCAGAATVEVQAGDSHKKLAMVEKSMALDEGVRALLALTDIGEIEITESKDGKLHIKADVRVKRKHFDKVKNQTDFENHVLVDVDNHELSIVNAHHDAADSDDWFVSLAIATPRPLSVNATIGIGDLHIRHAAGEAKLTVGVGSIKFDAPQAHRVFATTGTGEVHLTLGAVSGPISAESGVGEIVVKVKGSGLQETVSLSTGTGSITLELPAGINAHLDASTGMGSIKTLGCEGVMVKQQFLSSQASGQLGEGGPQFELSSGTGSIDLKCK